MRISFIVLTLITVTSCTLFDFSQLRLNTYPGSRNQILPAETRAIWVEFSEVVIRSDAERIVRLSSEAGTVEVDGAWERNRYTLVPLESFQEGLRYVLSIEGDVRIEDGRRFSEFVSLPFYVGSDSPPPALVSSTPESGAFVTSSQSVVLEFSSPMDTASVENAISISPERGVTLEWTEEERVVTITPTTRWDNGILYSWTVPAEAEDTRGTRMLEEYSGSFLVVDDVIAPSVVSVSPAFNLDSGGTPFDPLPGDLSALIGSEAIRVEFSEPMDSESALSSISIEPPISGVMVPVSPSVFAFAPGENWNLENEYVLTVAESATDPVGNQLVAEYREVFTVSTEKQEITQLTVSGTLTGTTTVSTADLTTGTSWTLPWDPLATDQTVTLSIDFRRPYTSDAGRTRIASNIRIDPVFPPGLAGPTLTLVTWVSSQELELTFGGLTKSDGQTIRYYEVRFPNLQSQTESGSFIVDEYELILESGS